MNHSIEDWHQILFSLQLNGDEVVVCPNEMGEQECFHIQEMFLERGRQSSLVFESEEVVAIKLERRKVQGLEQFFDVPFVIVENEVHRLCTANQQSEQELL